VLAFPTQCCLQAFAAEQAEAAKDVRMVHINGAIAQAEAAKELLHD